MTSIFIPPLYLALFCIYHPISIDASKINSRQFTFNIDFIRNGNMGEVTACFDWIDFKDIVVFGLILAKCFDKY